MLSDDALIQELHSLRRENADLRAQVEKQTPDPYNADTEGTPPPKDSKEKFLQQIRDLENKLLGAEQVARATTLENQSVLKKLAAAEATKENTDDVERHAEG